MRACIFRDRVARKTLHTFDLLEPEMLQPVTATTYVIDDLVLTRTRNEDEAPASWHLGVGLPHHGF
jgi:hypothetical protein